MESQSTMNEAEIIRTLESEWKIEQGFFWQIRQGVFVEKEFQRALMKVSSIRDLEDTRLNRRLVSLLWYIPLFMQWQVERISENGGDADAYIRALTTMTNEVERLLGTP